MIRFSLLLLSLLIVLRLSGQGAMKLSGYLPLQTGDTLFLEDLIGKDTLSITYQSSPADSNLLYIQMDRLGTWLIKIGPDGAPRLLSFRFPGGWEYQLQDPVLIFPDTIAPLEKHIYRSDLAVLLGGKLQGRGVVQLQTAVQRNDSARTPLRNFADCLVMAMHGEATGQGIPAFAFEFKAWYARDIGLVKLAGSYLHPGQGAPVQVATQLVRAFIGGEELAGARAKK